MKRLLFLMLFPLLLAACKPAATADPHPGETSTPLPTSTAKEFSVIASPACQVNAFEALRTRQPQGDLIAWDSARNRLAFVGPVNNSNWFSGRVFIVSGPEFIQPTAIAADAPAFGDLTWSPDSSQLAFVSFRQPEAYTILVAPLNGSPATDLFSLENARTDAWSGSKAIQEWRTEGTLRILTSCGEDCDQTLSINTNTGQISPVGEQLRKAPNRLWPQADERTFQATVFPPAMSNPAWQGRISPQMKAPTWTRNGKKVAYIDNNIYAWVLMIDQKIQYELDTPLVDVQELKWSPDGRYIAVRTDDKIVIFDTECN